MKKARISLKIERRDYGSWMIADYLSPLGETHQERHLLGIGVRPYHITVSEWINHNSENHNFIISDMTKSYMATHIIATSYGPDHDDLYASLKAD